MSLAGVVFSSAVSQAGGLFQLAGLAGGLLPLVIYHVILAREENLSSSSVDGIYYFGFLVTVITLVATAISLGFSPTIPSLRWVLLQFGLGLVATGYALFARLHLLTKASQALSVIEATEKLANSVTRVASQFDNATYQISAFIEHTEKRLEHLTQKHIEQIEQIENKSLQNMQIFSDKMQASIDIITTATNSAATASASSIATLAKTYNTTANLATSITNKLSQLDDLTTQISAINTILESVIALKKSTSDADAALSSLSKSATNAAASINKELVDPLQKIGISKSLIEAQSSLSHTTENITAQLDSLNKNISNANEYVNEASKTFRAIQISGQGMNYQMGPSKNVPGSGGNIPTAPHSDESMFTKLFGRTKN